jgi:hypothetical protein
MAAIQAVTQAEARINPRLVSNRDRPSRVSSAAGFSKSAVLFIKSRSRGKVLSPAKRGIFSIALFGRRVVKERQKTGKIRTFFWRKTRFSALS